MKATCKGEIDITSSSFYVRDEKGDLLNLATLLYDYLKEKGMVSKSGDMYSTMAELYIEINPITEAFKIEEDDF